jgi:hypothetical protein
MWRAVLAEIGDDGGIAARPPATEEAVAAFEAARGVTLPEEYRRFLREVADGILADGDPALLGLAELAADQGGDGAPAAPFTYGADEGAAIVAAIEAARAGQGPLADPAVMALQRPGRLDGCLTITSGDGNTFSAIVVTGAQRGRMWRTGELDAPEIEAFYRGDALAPLGFLDWLACWADHMLGISLADDAG